MDTLVDIRKRVSFLIGETNYMTKAQSTIIDSHINAAIKDIVNKYNYSWNVKTANLTLVAGVDDLSTDFNPRWGILDARIVNTGDSNDHVFTRIAIRKRDLYTADHYVYWLLYDTTGKYYTFNSKTQTGTVVVYYNFIPTALTANSDTCIVPDSEVVAYLAASKIYLGNKDNLAIKQEYYKEAQDRIKLMQESDIMFGEIDTVNSVIDLNSEINGGGLSSDFEIERP